MKFLSMLYKLEEIEEGMAKFYKSLFEKYPLNLKASTLFYKMYLEEKSHLNLVRYQKRVVWQNQSLFKDIDCQSGDCLESTSEEVRRALDMVEKMDLRQAVEKAIELEKGAAESHLKGFTRNSNLKFGLFLENLCKDDVEHYSKLERFLKTLKEKDDANEIAEQMLRKAISL